MASNRAGKKGEWVLETDGSSKGNPGRAGAAFILSRGDQVVAAGSKHLGVATNNVAEYTAVLMGLEEALRLGAESLTLVTDSRLVANQLLGIFQVRKEHLRPLNRRCRSLIRRLSSFKVRVVPSGKNRAHRLAEEASRGD